MKYCNDCQISFDDSESICCYCGMPLKSHEMADESANSSEFSNSESHIESIYPDSNIPFIQNYGFGGRSVEINGIAMSVNSSQYYQSKLTKFFRAVFSGEPYQLGHTTFENMIRVGESTPKGYSRQATDVVIYGNMQNIIANGDDLRIEAVRKGNRLVAKRIYNNATNSYIHVQGNIPAIVFRAFLLTIILLIFSAIHKVTTFSASENLGESILSSILQWLIIIAILLYIVKHAIKNLFK